MQWPEEEHGRVQGPEEELEDRGEQVVVQQSKNESRVFFSELSLIMQERDILKQLTCRVLCKGVFCGIQPLQQEQMQHWEMVRMYHRVID